MTKPGFIIWPRDALDHPVLQVGPFCRRAAWMWLVKSARWTPGPLHTAAGLTQVERGQIAATDNYLAHAWDWERTKVRRFIQGLCTAGLVRSERDQAVRVLTICDYDRYQAVPAEVAREALEQKRASRCTTSKSDDKRAGEQRPANFGSAGRAARSAECQQRPPDSRAVPGQSAEEAVDMLRKLSGMTEGHCREILGQLIATADGDARHVLQSLRRAQLSEPDNWYEWLIGACSKGHQKSNIERINMEQRQNHAITEEDLCNIEFEGYFP